MKSLSAYELQLISGGYGTDAQDDLFAPIDEMGDGFSEQMALNNNNSYTPQEVKDICNKVADQNLKDYKQQVVPNVPGPARFALPSDKEVRQSAYDSCQKALNPPPSGKG